MSALKSEFVMLAAPTKRRFLFAHWEGGGNTPPMLAIVRRLVARGHSVRVLSDPCNKTEVESTGASFSSWIRAPRRSDKSTESDPIKDWEVTSPLVLPGRLRDRLFVGPALAYARDLLEELKRFPANAVVTSEMLLGVMAAAESAGVPCAGLSANIYFYPLPGVPPFGPGLQPAKGLPGCLRDVLIRNFSLFIFGRGTAAFNATRRALGLPPITHPFEQTTRLTRHLVLTSAAFDFPATSLPENVVYTGPELDDPPWVEPWNSPWSAVDQRPLVVVGFSTTFQNQRQLLCRIIEALSSLNTRAVVTVGPALDMTDLPAAPNVFVCRSAPHNQLLPEAAVVVTHAGHGTVIRSLAAGVPLLCLPMGRDQNDNAARVVARGAGLRLSPKSSPKSIRNGVLEILETPRYREKAQELGKLIAMDARNSSVVQILEEVAATPGCVVRG
ncbi:MAG TPA: nucleotide disphospho-sugar-binding domain-containing protein [Pyrinomonadaceae bacterium]|nr:nucleotide disphospho-sugar-binding domain-containing protein [Pyrinomonadaceae bacterium]